jgi:hypothetical protein
VTTCVSSHLDYVSKHCNSKTSCRISISDSGFHAPCSGIFKYLDVYYDCGQAYIGPTYGYGKETYGYGVSPLCKYLCM